jgi:hypothetical protein
MNAPDQRRRDGSIHDRQPEAPWWVWLILAVMTAGLIAAGVIVIASERAASHASAAAGSSISAQRAARAATDRLQAGLFGACRRLQAERERINVEDATVWLVLRGAAETSPPKGRPRLRDLAEATSYAPPSNCQLAVQQPASYRAPPPIPFDRMPAGYAIRIVEAAKQHQPQPLP